MSRIAELMNLSGRRALVTGAAGNLGRVIADTLAELGADLVLVDRPEAGLDALTQSLRETRQVDVQSHPCDLADAAARAALIDALGKHDGGLSILVNNAAFVGTSDLEGWATDFEAQSVTTWRDALEVNLTAAFDLAKGLAPLLREGPGGCIVNIASIYGLHGPDLGLYEGTQMGNPAAYAASKGGLVQLTRYLATTLAPQVRSNCIAPGGIFRNQPAAFVERYERRTPLGRMATEDDLRGAVAYLASDLSRYCTGQILAVDGGWGAW